MATIDTLMIGDSLTEVPLKIKSNVSKTRSTVAFSAVDDTGCINVVFTGIFVLEQLSNPL
jgi:hypothetical protein